MSIIGHELAHQWFGNLVTMKWWDDLWLKEGFASYMSDVALDEMEPAWRMMDAFSVEGMQSAMAKDSDATSHAISFPVANSVDIRRIFDPISYSKGEAIIRMMHGFIGNVAFKSALNEFLTQFSYSNAGRDDLWAAMTKLGHQHNTLPSELDVKTIMDSWVLQPGYPVVNVTINGGSITLSQQRYMLPKPNENDTSSWYIPITYETESNRRQWGSQILWINGTKNVTINNAVEPDEWLYLNVKRDGYYRVNYDHATWVKLIKAANSLPPAALATLLDDSMNLARAEIVEYDVPLAFMAQLRAQDNLAWSALMPDLRYLNYMLNREPAYEHLTVRL